MMMERERFPHPALMAHEEYIRYVLNSNYQNNIDNLRYSKFIIF